MRNVSLHAFWHWFRNISHVELSYVLQYGYVAFFLILFAGEFSGFIPVGILMVAMGALARHGYFDFAFLLVLATVATALGNFTIYSVARTLGKQESYRKRIEENRFATRIEAHMQKHPGLTVFVSRFIGVIVVPTTALAGLSQVPRTTFLMAVAAGNAICCAIYLAVGYFLGAAWEQDARTASRIVLAVVVLLMIGYVIYYLISNRRKAA